LPVGSLSLLPRASAIRGLARRWQHDEQHVSSTSGATARRADGTNRRIVEHFQTNRRGVRTATSVAKEFTTMTADQNVATMRRAYEAFNTGDMDTLTELMDETVWHLPGRSPMAGDYQGRGACLAYFGQLAQETGGTFRAELQHMAADGEDRVIGIQRSTADRNGKHLDVANCIVFELKDGRVTDGREHFEDLYAWDEFWS